MCHAGLTEYMQHKSREFIEQEAMLYIKHMYGEHPDRSFETMCGLMEGP
jgi:hypothetical protein